MNDPEVRQRRIELARSIINHHLYQSKSDDERQDVIDELLAKGLESADLELILQEQSMRNTSALADLDKLALTEILIQSDPRDVLRTCQFNKQYKRVCDDSQVFVILLRAHYPEAFETNNPRQQYIALTDGVQTTYSLNRKPIKSIKTGIDSSSDIARFDKVNLVLKSSKPELTPGWSLQHAGRSKILDLLNNKIYLKWLDIGDRFYGKTVYIKDKIINDPYAIDVHKMSDQYANEHSISFLDATFKEFVKEYRDRARRIIPDLNSDQFQSTAITITTKTITPEDFETCDALVATLLEKGKMINFRPRADSSRIVFTVPGNSIPTGTQTWILIGIRENFVFVRKTREDVGRLFVDEYYDILYETLFERFEEYVYAERREYIDEIEDLSDDERMATGIFQEFLDIMRRQDGADTVILTRDQLYEYMMTNERFTAPASVLGHIYIIKPLTF